MDKKTMERLEHRLCAELDTIAEKQSMSIGDLDVVDKATHALKSMGALKMQDSGYSKAGGVDGSWTANGMYSRGGMPERSYNGGMVYADGSYSRTGYDRYSRADGPDAMREELRVMMDSGKLNQEQKEAAHKLMDALTK